MGGVPAERIEEVMGRIASESSRMATLVEDLLTLARLDEGRPLEITEIDLVKLADNAVFDLQALDPTRTVGLTGISSRTPPMTLIVPGDRDRISERFYRADTSRNRKSGGSGLGLAIVSGILAAHKGNASLTKTKGGGLTVRIELPTA